MDFALVKLAKDEQAAAICSNNSKIETDALHQALFAELACGFSHGEQVGRETVKWLISWSEKTWADRSNTDEVRGDAAYIRRLYP